MAVSRTELSNCLLAATASSPHYSALTTAAPRLRPVCSLQVVRRERTSVSFCRSFALPDNIREDDVSASLDKGVLTVTIPKAEPTPKPQPRRIAVQGVQATDAHQVAPAAPQEAGEGQAEAAAQE